MSLPAPSRPPSRGLRSVRAAPGDLRARRASQAAGALAGGLLLVATTVPWSGRGAGSRLALHRVGDLILSGAVDGWAPRGIGLVAYAVPVCGALLLIGAGLGGRGGAALSVVAVGLALAATATVISALDRLGRTGLGPGPFLVLIGSVSGLLGAALGAWATGRPTSGPQDPSPRTDPA